MPETASEGPSPAKTFTDPAFMLSPKNPAGWMLVVRADTIEEFVDRINQVLDPEAGERTDITNVLLMSFHPGVVADMAEGRTAEEAFGRELDHDAAQAYAALAQGARRQPAGTAAGNGGRSGGGGGGGAKVFVAPQIGDDLPPWFRDKLTRHDTCPQCRDPEGKFYDNREDPGKGPVFKCANADCKLESKDGKYAWGAWEPDSKPATSSRTR